MSKIKIVVTQKNIDQGIPHHPYACPVSLAIWSWNSEGVKVAGKPWGMNDPGWEATFIHLNKVVELPAEIGPFAKAFDRGEKVEPFEFEMESPYDHN